MWHSWKGTNSVETLSVQYKEHKDSKTWVTATSWSILIGKYIYNNAYNFQILFTTLIKPTNFSNTIVVSFDGCRALDQTSNVISDRPNLLCAKLHRKNLQVKLHNVNVKY